MKYRTDKMEELEILIEEYLVKATHSEDERAIEHFKNEARRFKKMYDEEFENWLAIL